MERGRRFDGRQCGLWQSVAHSGQIKTGAWGDAAAAGGVIGTCRSCGGYLVPDDPYRYGDTPLEWYIARCLECGHECAAPGGRVLHKSGRASERGTR